MCIIRAPGEPGNEAIMSHILHFHVSYLMSHVSCLMSHVSCLIHWIRGWKLTISSYVHIATFTRALVLLHEICSALSVLNMKLTQLMLQGEF